MRDFESINLQRDLYAKHLSQSLTLLNIQNGLRPLYEKTYRLYHRYSQ